MLGSLLHPRFQVSHTPHGCQHNLHWGFWEAPFASYSLIPNVLAATDFPLLLSSNIGAGRSEVSNHSIPVSLTSIWAQVMSTDVPFNNGMQRVLFQTKVRIYNVISCQCYAVGPTTWESLYFPTSYMQRALNLSTLKSFLISLCMSCSLCCWWLPLMLYTRSVGERGK